MRRRYQQIVSHSDGSSIVRRSGAEL